MLKVKQPKNIPQEINRFTDPVNGREYAAMQALFAVLSTYQVAGPVLEARLRKLGGGIWRDFRMIQVKMDRIIRALLSTVPVNKLQQIERNFSMTRVYVKTEAPGIATKDASSWVYVPATALDYVLNVLIENNCLLCDKTEVEGRHCPHRKALEDCLPHQVDVARGSERCKFSDLSLGLDEIKGVM